MSEDVGVDDGVDCTWEALVYFLQPNHDEEGCDDDAENCIPDLMTLSEVDETCYLHRKRPEKDYVRKPCVQQETERREKHVV